MFSVDCCVLLNVTKALFYYHVTLCEKDTCYQHTGMVVCNRKKKKDTNSFVAFTLDVTPYKWLVHKKGTTHVRQTCSETPDCFFCREGFGVKLGCQSRLLRTLSQDEEDIVKKASSGGGGGSEGG